MADVPVQTTQSGMPGIPDTAPATTTPAPTPAPVANPNDPAAVQAQMAAPLAAEQTALGKATDLANTPAAVPVAGPHARLVSMVQGLALGMDAFGTSLATRGKEGGVREVQQVQAEQQNQKIQAQQAAAAQKNTQIQQQLTVADTNHKLAQNILFMHTVPNEMAQSDITVKKGKLDIVSQMQDIRAKALQDFMQTGDKAAYDATLAQTGGTSAATGATPAGGAAPAGAAPTGAAPAASGIPPVAVAAWKNSVDAAASAYPNDPAIQSAQAVLANPQSTSQQMALAANGAKQRMTALDAGVKSRTEQAGATEAEQKANPLFKFESDPKALVDPGAQATLQAYVDDPKNAGNINGLAQAKMLMTKAGIAQQHEIDLAGQKAQATKNAEMAASAGDPKVAGQMLYDGGLTLADLKSRGSSPKQITDAVGQAQAIAKEHGQTYNASDEIVGEHTLQQPTNQVFFGSARSLVQGGGMLDQLKAAHDALGATKVPSFNTIQQWRNYQAGSPELATYRAAVLNSADDAAKVMGGGTPTDSLRDLFMQTFNANIGNLGFDGAIKQTRDGVRSQVTGRIGNNRYVMQREGDTLRDTPAQAAPAGSPASKIHASMADFLHEVTAAKGKIYSDDGKTWYDALGQPVTGK
jgi:hypothetical protein